MVIEWMRVRVEPRRRERYIDVDRKVWTPGLAREEGFLGKEVWQGEDPGEIVLVIRWRSEQEWKRIPPEHLRELEERFDREFGASYEVVETRTYRPADAVR